MLTTHNGTFFSYVSNTRLAYLLAAAITKPSKYYTVEKREEMGVFIEHVHCGHPNTPLGRTLTTVQTESEIARSDREQKFRTAALIITREKLR